VPSVRDPFIWVQISPNRLQLLGLQFISVHEHSPQVIPTAEVDAEVSPLRSVQKVKFLSYWLCCREQLMIVEDNPT
jgi:hypothetical protein